MGRLLNRCFYTGPVVDVYYLSANAQHQYFDTKERRAISCVSCGDPLPEEFHDLVKLVSMAVKKDAKAGTVVARFYELLLLVKIFRAESEIEKLAKTELRGAGEGVPQEGQHHQRPGRHQREATKDGHAKQLEP
ncbi:uncharacterized protein CCOS01_16215 [Colletotrichum costaricense]|uniref:Uncharacterized protein n=1 Tax=Colletotrichum costaricense TaxID=1209916 RepID=A0AAI9YG43_9PEZI|nr:uncharacterized protein CCOS01_16215 [Colletotrichum costaricense]KAK1507909.1 hypothetical protein CCOS01_16215 [Colletotrichum costaricense]